MKGPIMLVLITALITGPLFADTIKLKSGETYTGKIIEETEDYVRLKTDSKILRIKRSAIAEESTPDVEVEVEAKKTEPEKVSVIRTATRDAETDAERDVNKVLWLGCGLMTLYLAVGAAYFIVPSAKQERIVGKSFDYVWVYAKAYKSKLRSLQTRYALIGCFIAGVTATIFSLYILSTEGCDVGCCTGPDLSCDPDLGCADSDGCSDSDGCGSSPSSSDAAPTN